jgi:GT2 family glycosyltransferase
MALFSARPEYAEVEFIYVLDDPPKRREAQNLFTSIHERFLIPFRAILLDRNVGFAPANNVGLRQARGEYVAYLNSDVFPGTQDWLEQLAARLEADPGLGVVGPLLLFEDGSVQHRGMFFERLAEFGNWYFCQHLDKGLRYTGGNELQRFVSITGACMLLRRELAVQVGGFDEIFAIGDFEDSDLCLKLQALGHACAVDPDVRLYHLERKSQISAAMNWRMNLTAYNAWQHERRWSETITRQQEIAVGGRL